MTPEQLARLFSPELNLSPEARSLIAHVSTLDGGVGEIAYARLLRMLQVQDEKKLRRAVDEAEDSGWVAVERQTGRGHHPRFTFTPPKIGTLSDSPPKNDRLNADSLPENGRVNRTSSSTSSSSSSGAREREDDPADDLTLARLRQALAPHDEPLDRLRRSTGGAAWAADVWGWYRPPAEGQAEGTEWGDFKGLTVPEAMQALARAIGDFASAGEGWSRRLFRGFVRKAAGETRRTKAALERESATPAYTGPELPGRNRPRTGGGGFAAARVDGEVWGRITRDNPGLVEQLQRERDEVAGEDPARRAEVWQGLVAREVAKRSGAA